MSEPAPSPIVSFVADSVDLADLYILGNKGDEGPEQVEAENLIDWVTRHQSTEQGDTGCGSSSAVVISRQNDLVRMVQKRPTDLYKLGDVMELVHQDKEAGWAIGRSLMYYTEHAFPLEFTEQLYYDWNKKVDDETTDATSRESRRDPRLLKARIAARRATKNRGKLCPYAKLVEEPLVQPANAQVALAQSRANVWSNRIAVEKKEADLEEKLRELEEEIINPGGGAAASSSRSSSSRGGGQQNQNQHLASSSSTTATTGGSLKNYSTTSSSKSNNINVFQCLFVVGIESIPGFRVVHRILGFDRRNFSSIEAVAKDVVLRVRGRGTHPRDKHIPLQIQLAVKGAEAYLLVRHMLEMLLKKIYASYEEKTGVRAAVEEQDRTSSRSCTKMKESSCSAEDYKDTTSSTGAAAEELVDEEKEEKQEEDQPAEGQDLATPDEVETVVSKRCTLMMPLINLRILEHPENSPIDPDFEKTCRESNTLYQSEDPCEDVALLLERKGTAPWARSRGAGGG
ncbi:unnamed protein product [Amoebophrya sp. A25]|nr:unnamed protein product [Amoebophrya sp. A25]|eukprot:GSA25T00021055001.1